ncbi:hypothetical protein DPMN_017542 [Dreissena polymorpha]|uniref:Uncharacterized protein n=1 Tax=Dreissena polymorpha TaxID=45954 RepID=A0A9D4NFE4_DREPO|nr:hypothetical protein DPMN_017542 [Dreissena polymorpha]
MSRTKFLTTTSMTFTIFELFQDLSKFHEDWTKNVSSRLFTCFHYIHIKKTSPPPGGHVFRLITTIFKLVQYIHITNEKDPPGGHVFLPIQTIYELNCRIQSLTQVNRSRKLTKYHEDWIKLETNVLTKLHEDWANKSKAYRPERSLSDHLKTATHPGGHVFPPIMTIFELVRDIYKIDAKNVTSRVFTSFFYHVFLPIQTIFELNRQIQKTHVLTKVHEDWTKHVTSRVFTCFHYIHIEKTAPPPGGYVFSPIWTIFEHFVTSRVFTRNTAPAPGGHVFQRTGTKLHEDWASNVASTVFTIFNLSRGIKVTNVLTKFQEDRTIHVASRVFTWQTVDVARRTKYDARRTKGDHKSSP